MTRTAHWLIPLLLAAYSLFHGPIPSALADGSAAETRSGTGMKDSGNSRATAAEPRMDARRFHEINNDLRDLVRRFARAESEAEKAAIVRQMCTLYLEIKRDGRLATSDTLQSYKARLWSVLTHIQEDIQKQLARRERLEGTSGGAQDEPSNRGIQSSPGDQETERASESLAGTLSLLGGALGGPGDVLAHGGGSAHGSGFGGGAGPADLGPALVELIQRTIAPEFWDVHGGPGTIVYFAPLRVLVVRATSEVHHNIGGAVQGLRRAGN